MHSKPCDSALDAKRGQEGEEEAVRADLPDDALAVCACIQAALFQKPYRCFENPIQLHACTCRAWLKLLT